MNNEPKKKKPALAGEWLAMGIALGVCIGLVGPGLKKKIKKDKPE